MKKLCKTTSLILMSALTFSASTALAQGTTGEPGVDSDGDGIHDDIDAEPCDNRVSIKRFDPADRTWGMMLFEDSWPEKGDFDFNDVVIAYNQVLSYDSGGLFTGIRLDIRVMAAGAHYTNGLAFHVPNVPAAQVENLQLFVDGQPQPITTRPGEVDLVVDLSSDLHALLGVPSRTWVNTDPAVPAVPYVDITLMAEFNPGVGVAASNAPFDIFLFNRARQTEVHLPQFRGTSSLNTALLGTADDGSSPTRAFVTTAGIPFALVFPEQVTYPNEGTSIASLFPTIVDFGLQLPGSQNFYRNPVLAHAYGNVSPGAFGATASTDVSCFTADPGQCGAAASVGSVSAPSTGLCGFGTASAVSSSGGLWRWDCTGIYSTPTACTAPDLVCTPNLSSGCTIANGSGNQVCNGSGTGYGACTLNTCNSGYYASGNTCLAQVCTPGSARSCSVTNGAGTETCNNLGSRYQNCTLTSCDAGFTVSGNTCLPTAATDADGDGIADDDEPNYGTDVNNADSDGDGMRDGVELAMRQSPTTPNARPSASGTPVSSCQALSQGQTYHLTQDISTSGSECFTPARDVTLDCRGYSIIGNGTGVGIYLSGHKYNFTLRNCEIRNFRAGIYASAHNYYLEVYNSALHNNTEYGVQTQHHNYFTRIEDSRATFNGQDGLHLDDFGQVADLRDNIVEHNGGNGVLIREYRSWSWSWSNPTFTLSGGESFSVCGNQVSRNGSCEYSIYSSNGAGTPQLAPGCHEPAPAEPACPCSPGASRGCNIANGTGSETCNASGTGYGACTAVSCAPGYFVANNSCVPVGNATDSDGDGLADFEEASFGSSSVLADSDGDGMRDGIEIAMGTNPAVANARPTATGTPVSSCQSLSQGQSYYLTQDVSTTGADCFTAGRNVTLDCRGHSISGDGGSAGISLGGHRYGFTLRNCEVRHFRAGVYASAHNYSMQIFNSMFHSNTEYGVQTQHHNYFTRIEDSRASFNGQDGLHLDDFAQVVDLRDNTVTYNGANGVLIREYRSWTWSWSNPTFTLSGGETFSLCGNQVAGNGGCEYSIYSGNGPGSAFIAPGCYEPAPAENACP